MENAAVLTQAARVEALAHTPLAKCYQCGKCTAGCPVAAHMDVVPNQLIRLLQLERAETALASAAIWNCVSCQTCSARCPKEVDIAAVLDALREIALREGATSNAEAQTVIAFQQAFLENVRRNGRLGEFDLVMRFKLGSAMRTRQIGWLFKDAGLAPEMSKRKKLHLHSERARDCDVVGRIFARCSPPQRTSFVGDPGSEGGER